ncbi:hypothetical protein NECAME_14949 [Necator americanus]|uniref:Uncharacterized protein n=1 Tax=Necator americanus TaxID=51031 RepID=W2SKQ4_NECAM|nr:hypothetical protein NECAME_14949 [Necator americanus]ETN70138.1 hypothetical protein NECAME_14949 [Necator americanus]
MKIFQNECLASFHCTSSNLGKSPWKQRRIPSGHAVRYSSWAHSRRWFEKFHSREISILKMRKVAGDRSSQRKIEANNYLKLIRLKPREMLLKSSTYANQPLFVISSRLKEVQAVATNFTFSQHL